MTKADFLRELEEKLQKGELSDPSIITKVELADEKLINMYLKKVEENKSDKLEKADNPKEENWQKHMKAADHHAWQHAFHRSAALDPYRHELGDIKSPKVYDATIKNLAKENRKAAKEHWGHLVNHLESAGVPKGLSTELAHRVVVSRSVADKRLSNEEAEYLAEERRPPKTFTPHPYDKLLSKK